MNSQILRYLQLSDPFTPLFDTPVWSQFPLRLYLGRAVNRQPCLPRGMTRRALLRLKQLSQTTDFIFSGPSLRHLYAKPWASSKAICRRKILTTNQHTWVPTTIKNPQHKQQLRRKSCPTRAQTQRKCKIHECNIHWNAWDASMWSETKNIEYKHCILQNTWTNSF